MGERRPTRADLERGLRRLAGDAAWDIVYPGRFSWCDASKLSAAKSARNKLRDLRADVPSLRPLIRRAIALEAIDAVRRDRIGRKPIPFREAVLGRAELSRG